ncbi:DUF6907 domain-containing protein [Microbacterium sp. CFBP 8794]|uniref:DUF6907 domain-containing protein n=1 Tax=Microbacterium sp. CFBP 8794 TaxID=2775269 RepID=UPI003F881054
MTHTGNASECPPWCAGHDDGQEPSPPRWHRSDGHIVPVVERRRVTLGGSAPAPLTAEDYVVALERDAQATYLYIGPLEDGTRFIAVTTDSAERLNAAIRIALASAHEHRRRNAAPSS